MRLRLSGNFSPLLEPMHEDELAEEDGDHAADCEGDNLLLAQKFHGADVEVGAPQIKSPPVDDQAMDGEDDEHQAKQEKSFARMAKAQAHEEERDDNVKQQGENNGQPVAAEASHGQYPRGRAKDGATNPAPDPDCQVTLHK